VKARVTSHQRLRVRIPPAARVAVAQQAEQWTNTRTADSRRKSFRCEDHWHRLQPVLISAGSKCRDGAEQSYFVCHTMWGDTPQLFSIFLPATIWPARIANQSAVRAGAGRLRAFSSRGATRSVFARCSRNAVAQGRLSGPEAFSSRRQDVSVNQFCNLKGLDVVKDRVTSPMEREDVGSNPTWSIWGPVAQWTERLCSLAACSRPAV
jgi:hypothetical protein